MISERILEFYKELSLMAALPKGVSFMNPFQDEEAFKVCSSFYRKFFSDDNKRKVILGINPGRNGGGITGVPFTDPIKLERYCGIPNNFVKKPELSADFIYAMIEGYGGPERFYHDFYISALSPLGFIKDGKNLNYYDIKELQDIVTPFIVECIEKQTNFPLATDVAFCLGEGENFRFLKKLNEKHSFFQHIVPLPHPRFIMQYKRKKVDEYVKLYVNTLVSSGRI